jgi:hypothetical protein
MGIEPWRAAVGAFARWDGRLETARAAVDAGRALEAPTGPTIPTIARRAAGILPAFTRAVSCFVRFRMTKHGEHNDIVVSTVVWTGPSLFQGVSLCRIAQGGVGTKDG